MTFFKPADRATKKNHIRPHCFAQMGFLMSVAHLLTSSETTLKWGFSWWWLISRPPYSHWKQVHLFPCLVPQETSAMALGESPLTTLNAMCSPNTSILGSEGCVFLACRGSHRTAKEEATSACFPSCHSLAVVAAHRCCTAWLIAVGCCSTLRIRAGLNAPLACLSAAPCSRWSEHLLRCYQAVLQTAVNVTTGGNTLNTRCTCQL